LPALTSSKVIFFSAESVRMPRWARVVMPVDLFGQPADYVALEPIIKREKLLRALLLQVL